MILFGAALVDFWVGDPWGWPHPVRGMGLVIQATTTWIRLSCSHPRSQRIAGIVLGLGLVGGSAALGWLLVRGAGRIHPLLGEGMGIILLASCFAGRSLRQAAESVLGPLALQDLPEARNRLQLYVGRDTGDLSETEVLRALLETVAENSVDGVMGPLFFALLGLGWPALGSAPLALAYKAASTLDSMVGYRHQPYTYLGWFSARLEDGLTWLPCRATVATLALLSGQPRRVWRLCCRDAPADPSPNSGWSEAAYAAILGVQLGGVNWYQGVARLKPPLGDPCRPITPIQVRQALDLTRTCFLFWLSLGVLYCVYHHHDWGGL